MNKAPLFIPLRSEHFRAFANGSKTVEYRRHGPRWNERLVEPGRAVILSHGYSGERLSGVVRGVSFTIARDVPGASAIYPPDAELIAIAIRLDGRPPRPRRSARGHQDRPARTPAAAAASRARR